MRAILSKGLSLVFLMVLALSACKTETVISPAPSALPGTPLPNVITPIPATPTATLPPKPTGGAGPFAGRLPGSGTPIFIPVWQLLARHVERTRGALRWPDRYA